MNSPGVLNRYVAFGVALAASASALAVLSPLGAALILAAVGVAVLALRQPEVLLVSAALVVPSGAFHAELRVNSPLLGDITPLSAVLYLAGIALLLIAPSRFAYGLHSAPGIIGIALAIAGAVSAISVAETAALYWVVNGGVALVVMAGLVAQRYRESPARLEAAVFVAAWVLAASVLAEALVGHAIAWLGTTPRISADPLFRPGGLIGNPVVAGCALAVITALRLSSTSIARLRYLQALFFSIAALVTLSRSAVLLLLVVIAAFALAESSGRLGRRLSVSLGGLAALAALLAIVGADLRERTQDGVSTTLRLANLELAAQLSLNAPWFGLGFGGFKRYALAYVYPIEQASLATVDNAYLNALVELGVFGVAMLALGACVVFLVRRRVGGQGDPLPLLCWLATGLFFDHVFHESMLLLLCVCLLKATNGLALTRRKPQLARPFAGVRNA